MMYTVFSLWRVENLDVGAIEPYIVCYKTRKTPFVGGKKSKVTPFGEQIICVWIVTFYFKEFV